jgi:hypothetical protein
MSNLTTKPTIKRGGVIPDFTLDLAGGGSVSSRSYYMRRNLALVFVGGGNTGEWHGWLDRLAAQRERIDAENGRALIIAAGAADLESGEFPLLLDRDGAVRERFGLNASDGAVFVTDRYGVVFHISLGTPETGLIAAEDIPGWLEFIACRCS